MRLHRILRHRLTALFQRTRVDDELQRELNLHLDQLIREHKAAGMSEHDAALAAHREFGSVEWTKEECRDMRRISFVDDLLKDVRYAARVLWRSPAFTLTAIGSLALGIGANTAIFGIVNAFLLRPLPFDHPDRLVALFERNVVGSEQMGSLAPGNFLDWQASAASFDGMSAYTMRTLTLAGDAPGAEPRRIMVCTCSGTLFSTLGVAPIVGRSFLPDEDRFGAPRAVVIGYDLWQRQFGGAADLTEKAIRMNDQDYQVAGVMPRTFVFPSRSVEAWVPILTTMSAQMQLRHDLHNLQVVARLRADVPRERAVAELDAIAARYKNAHPNESTGKGATVTPLHDVLVNNVRTPLIVLLGAVTCVLLIACVNIANLMLTRATVRSRELGIRTALGAGRGRIIRQLMTESLMLGLAGGAGGAALAVWIAKLLLANAPGADAMLQAGAPPIDATVFGFAFLTAIGTGIAVGLVPALRGSRADVTNDLNDVTRSATAGRAHGRFRDALVAVEVGLSLVLLVAAGLLFHSFSRLHQVEPGVRIDHRLTMNTVLPQVRYPDPAKRSAMLEAMGDRVRALPGVASAGLTSCAPLTGACNVLFFYIEGRAFEAGKFLTAMERSVDPQYFSAAGIPLVRGRTLTKTDGAGFDPKHPRLGAVVISDSMAKTFFGDDDPIGKRIFFDFELQSERNQGLPAPRYEIVGIVGDVRPTLDSRIQPTFYRPLLDVANNGAAFVVHTAVEPLSVAASIRNEIRKLDPGLVLSQPQTMEELVGRSTADRRFTMILFLSFAALAVLLAAVGLYGVVSYAVSQRTTEIGIRMALGATSGSVNRLVVMQGLKPALAGIALGLVGAGAASQLLRTLLFGVTPVDPLTFAIVPPALLVVAAVACYLPAARAARLDPTVALRAQ
jgi:predicted permease